MNYLKKIKLINERVEESILHHLGAHTIYNNSYPYEIFPKKKLSEIQLDSITIFYGNNGSGKTTLLNIIADKIEAERRNEENKGDLFKAYVNATEYELNDEYLNEKKIILSDDVFDYLLDVKAINSDVNRRKDLYMNAYEEIRQDTSNIHSALEQYEELRTRVNARKMTKSGFVKSKVINNNIISKSNGESAIEFWENQILEDGLYLLDEPENSLSAKNQLKLKEYIEDAVRYRGCQFIIATHSPFFLALDNAVIYSLDSVPSEITKWYELDNMKAYYEFFSKYKDDFEK